MFNVQSLYAKTGETQTQNMSSNTMLHIVGGGCWLRHVLKQQEAGSFIVNMLTEPGYGLTFLIQKYGIFKVFLKYNNVSWEVFVPNKSKFIISHKDRLSSTQYIF